MIRQITCGNAACGALVFMLAIGIPGQLEAQTLLRPQSEVNVIGFTDPEKARDSNPGTFAYASVGRVCHNTCTNATSATATVEAFPADYGPVQLTVAWWAYAAHVLPSGNAGVVTATLEYDSGGGWQTAETYNWTQSSPSCSGGGEITCSTHYALATLNPNQNTGALKVRVTLTAQLTQCSTCGLFGTANVNAQVKIYDITVEAVCAIPTDFHQTAAYDAGNGVLHFEYAWSSSTGVLSNLKCDIGERVDYSPSDLPLPSPPFPVGINPGTPYVENTASSAGQFQDNHLTAGSFVAPYTAKTVVAAQIYRYRCSCYSVGDWVALMGPHNSTRSVLDNGDGTWRFEVTKTGASATIDPLP